MAKVSRKGGPGRSDRDGLSVIELFKMFPDDRAAEKWFEAQRWPDGSPVCPDCGSINCVETAQRKPMPYRCRDCRSHFSVRKGTVMQSSKLPLQKWVIAIYMMTTGIKGTSSLKLHRELGIRQGTAWHMLQRIREAFIEGQKLLSGPVEVDETYVGGKRKNMHKSKRGTLTGRGPVGKAAVVGVKDRESNEVVALPVASTDGKVLQQIIEDHVAWGAVVYTDEAPAYSGLSKKYQHETVKHSVGEYVRSMASTNGIESFWAMLKRGYQGVYHQMSEKHLGRYVTEFSTRHNIRDFDTLDQMAYVARGMAGKLLPYKKLIR